MFQIGHDLQETATFSPSANPSGMGTCRHLSDLEARVQTVFQLSPPFASLSSINIHWMDIYSQETFNELIQEREKEGLPYFLAVTCDNAGTTQVVDGTAFIRSYFKHENHASPTTREGIREAQIYRIDSLKDQHFQFLCSLPQLTENKGHFAKLINACDPNLTPVLRGQERYYLGAIFERGKASVSGTPLVVGDLNKSLFWYQKSIEDGYFGAHIALATWHERGNSLVARCKDKVIEHLTLATKCITPPGVELSDVHRTLAFLNREREDEIAAEKKECYEDLNEVGGLMN